MFNPTKTWRKWHRKINVNQRRYAVCSALAASALPSLVMARGHKISKVAECPVVMGADAENCDKTSKAMKMLENLGALEDVEKSKSSRRCAPARARCVTAATCSAWTPRGVRRGRWHQQGVPQHLRC